MINVKHYQENWKHLETERQQPTIKGQLRKLFKT